MAPSLTSIGFTSHIGWTSFLSALVLLLVRISGLMIFAPPFSSPAIPARIKVGFAVACAVVLTPLAAATNARIDLGFESILGELAVGFVLGVSVLLVQEVLTFAGQLLNLQFSFSLVNVLDPSAKIETPLMSQLLNLLFLLVVFSAGLHQVIIEALLRTIIAVPLGQARAGALISPALGSMFGGVLAAGLQLASPVMAATLLVEVTIALMSKMAPQLPALVLGIPVKTMTGYFVLAGSLALWPRFIDQRLSALLDTTLRIMARHPHA